MMIISTTLKYTVAAALESMSVVRPGNAVRLAYRRSLLADSLWNRPIGTLAVTLSYILPEDPLRMGSAIMEMSAAPMTAE